MNHVAFGVPVLVLAVPEDLDELLEDGSMAAAAALGELGGVVVMAVDMAIVFVIAVLGAKHGRAQGASEVVDVILAFEGGDVRPPQGSAALMAQEPEAAEVVRLAEGVLAPAVLVVCREEFGGYNLPAVLQSCQQQKAQAPGSRSQLTRHLKQSKWKVPSSARTNCPVRGSPHFLHARTWPLADLEPRGRDLFLSPLRLDSVSVFSALSAGETGGLPPWLPWLPLCRECVGARLACSWSFRYGASPEGCP